LRFHGRLIHLSRRFRESNLSYPPRGIANSDAYSPVISLFDLSCSNNLTTYEQRDFVVALGQSLIESVDTLLSLYLSLYYHNDPFIVDFSI